MLISLCIPCMNRTYALKQALPAIINAANYSPPVEIVVLNYSSRDDLEYYMEDILQQDLLVDGNMWKYVVEPGKKYYHSTHARNLCVQMSSGEYFIMLSAEALPALNAFKYIRSKIETDRPVWMCENKIGRWIICQRQEFIDSGGYDERFNVYSPEEKDLCLRLHRRGGKFETFPGSLIEEIPTSNKEKLLYLDSSTYNGNIWIKRQMHRAMMKIFEENNNNNILVVNEGKDWRGWDTI